MELPKLPRCGGIVVIHRDLSLTCTQHPCGASPTHPPGSDGWLFAHVGYYSCDVVLGERCPRCHPTSPPEATEGPGAPDAEAVAHTA